MRRQHWPVPGLMAAEPEQFAFGQVQRLEGFGQVGFTVNASHFNHFAMPLDLQADTAPASWKDGLAS